MYRKVQRLQIRATRIGVFLIATLISILSAQSETQAQPAAALCRELRDANDLAKAFDNAIKIATPMRSSFATPLLRSDRVAQLLIDLPPDLQGANAVNATSFIYYVQYSTDPNARVWSNPIRSLVRQLDADATAKLPKRAELIVGVPSASSFLGFTAVEYRVIACAPEANPPPPVQMFFTRANGEASNWWFAVIVTFVLLIAIYVLCALARSEKLSVSSFNPLRITTGVTGFASLSNLQFFAFTFLVGGLVVYTLLRTGQVVDVSETVGWLLGIVGIGSVAARMTVPQRERLSGANVQWLQQQGWLPKDPKTSDLIAENGEIVIDRLQGLVFGSAVFVALLMQGGDQLATFTVPTGILGILATSQLIYVGGKVARSGVAAPTPQQQPATGGTPPSKPEPTLDELVSVARLWEDKRIAAGAAASSWGKAEKDDYENAVGAAVRRLNLALGTNIYFRPIP